MPRLGALAAAAVVGLLFLLYGPHLGEQAARTVERGDTALTAALAGGDPVRGGETWKVQGCAGCHGLHAEGGGFPGAPPLARAARSCTDLHAAVRSPRDPATGMPPFTLQQLPDAAISDLCAWLASLR